MDIGEPNQRTFLDHQKTTGQEESFITILEANYTSRSKRLAKQPKCFKHGKGVIRDNSVNHRRLLRFAICSQKGLNYSECEPENIYSSKTVPSLHYQGLIHHLWTVKVKSINSPRTRWHIWPSLLSPKTTFAIQQLDHEVDTDRQDVM